KVQIVQNFRGREMLHKERGRDRMQEIIRQLADLAKVEVPPRIMGRRITMILAPDRAKIEQIKQREAAQQSAPAAEAPTGQEPEAAPAAEAPTGQEPEAEPAPAEPHEAQDQPEQVEA
ncbi:MAG: translation initiation factor IF-3, partial [Planctomycetota bacterium]